MAAFQHSHLDLVLVKGGNFTMGDDHGGYADEKPAHPVNLGDFFINKYPVTQALWKAVMGADNNPSYFIGDRRPVDSVSWRDTQVFLGKLNELTGKTYRLPTEAEWEYAARGGNRSRGYTYAGGNKLKEVGWYWANSHKETKAVGQKDPNGLGLYDMSGNVWEWCLDWFSNEYYEVCHKKVVVPNPQGPEKGVNRIFRGGSWINSPAGCRVVSRGNDRPESHDYFVGFRPVLSLQLTGRSDDFH